MDFNWMASFFNLRKDAREHPWVFSKAMGVGIILCALAAFNMWNFSEKRAISALEKELSSVEEERDIVQRSNNSLKEEVANLKVERDNFVGDLDDLEEKAGNLANQVSALRTQVAETESRNQELQVENEELQAEANRLNSALQAQISEHEQYSDTIRNLEQYVQSCEAGVRETKDRLSELPRYLRSGLSEGTQRSWENPDYIALTEEIKDIESECKKAKTKLLSEY